MTGSGKGGRQRRELIHVVASMAVNTLMFVKRALFSKTKEECGDTGQILMPHSMNQANCQRDF